MSIKPIDNKSEVNVAKALRRFTKEDPTFRVSTDPESNETIIHGMGELHLDVYIERMRREYNAAVETSPPQVAYRETVSKLTDLAKRCALRSEGLCFVTGEAGLIPRQDLHQATIDGLEILRAAIQEFKNDDSCHIKD